MKLRYVTVPIALALLVPSLAYSERGFTVRDLATLDRVSSPTLSPDGRKLVFAKRVVDFDANKSSTSLWIEDLAARDAAPPVRLTPDGWNVNSPAFSQDGKSVYFLSAKSGSQQLYAIPVGGGKPRQLTDFALDVDAYALSPDGKRIAFAAGTFADCASDLACTKKRLDDVGKKKATGVVFDRMFIRHWDTWNDGRLNRVLVTTLPSGDSAKPVNTAAVVGNDLIADVPSKPFGDFSDLAWSPDGSTLVVSARKADRSEPWSTNFDLYQVNADGSGVAKNLTPGNPAWDAGPVFSADGKTLYYRA
ncbi:MAG: S9 family peptidase, partial [Gammaproteobacteria bacterium]|nr:S9 family peptidase [Gammaproteobacteria bacterium]